MNLARTLDAAEDEASYAEAEENWEQFQRDGLHLTWEELRDHMRALLDGKDAEPPPCHT